MIVRVTTLIDDSMFKDAMNKFPAAKEQANRAAGITILDDVEDRFEGEGFPPEKWVALSPITIKRREGRANGGPIKILNDTGMLKNSFMIGDEDNYFQATKAKVTVGTPKKYAAPHQWGWAARNLPARPMIVDPVDSPDLLLKLTKVYSAILNRAMHP